MGDADDHSVYSHSTTGVAVVSGVPCLSENAVRTGDVEWQPTCIHVYRHTVQDVLYITYLNNKFTTITHGNVNHMRRETFRFIL